MQGRRAHLLGGHALTAYPRAGGPHLWEGLVPYGVVQVEVRGACSGLGGLGCRRVSEESHASDVGPWF